jgi:hypothetical protein
MFTNHLRRLLKEYFPNNPYETLTGYEQLDAKAMLKIKGSM